MEAVKYQFPGSMKEMLAEEAKSHLATCPLEGIRQPLPHINPWLQALIERRSY